MINLEQLQKAVEYWKTVPEMEDSVLLDTARLVIEGVLTQPLSRTELIGIIKTVRVGNHDDNSKAVVPSWLIEPLADAILKGRV